MNIYTLLISLNFFKLLKQLTIFEKNDKMWDLRQTNTIYKYNILISSLKSRENIQEKSMRQTVQFQILSKI